MIKDKTVLIIAHRMRTVMNADQIVLLSGGRVAEMGSPAELLKRTACSATWRSSRARAWSGRRRKLRDKQDSECNIGKQSVENKEAFMKETNKWSVRDVITTVLLSAVLIVIQLVVNMVCMANDFVSMVLSVGITMFLCAPVYMLMVSRIGKRFVTLLYMTLLGVIFLLMGNWFLLPYFIVTGVICEAILWKEGSCQKPKRLTAAWTAASLLYNGVNLLPIWFFWDTYYDFALASGMEQSYIDS